MNPYVIGGGVLAALALVVGIIFGLNRWEKNIEERGYNRAMAEVSAKAVIEEEKQRKIEQARVKAQQEAQDENQRQINKAKTDAASANAAVVSLRKQLADLSNRAASSDTTLATSGATAATLGVLLGNCAERYSIMAAEADAARAAGNLCQASYDALGASP